MQIVLKLKKLQSKRCFSVFVCLFVTVVSVSCGKTEPSGPALECPFTEMNWNSTIEDVTAAEGEAFSTYDSVYGGLCYTYPKEYAGYSGTVKYMFNEEEALMSVAWAYSAKDADELTALYDSINADVNAQYGESGYQASGVGNYGNVWYLESGDIILSTMITSEMTALQYAYLHPLVSNTEKQQDKAK